MTKVEAKKLIKDYIQTMMNIRESDDNLASYLDNPDGTIVFDDGGDFVCCPHCGSEHISYSRTNGIVRDIQCNVCGKLTH